MLIVGEGDVLENREVQVAWKEKGADGQDNVIVNQGLKDGEVVCLTPLGYGAAGTKVLPAIAGEAPPVRPGRPNGANNPSGKP